MEPRRVVTNATESPDRRVATIGPNVEMSKASEGDTLLNAMIRPITVPTKPVITSAFPAYDTDDI